MLVWVATGGAAVLGLLAVWQRWIDGSHRSNVAEAVKAARSLGAEKAVGLHPRIEHLACLGCSSCIRACPEHGVIELVDGVARVVRISRCIGHGVCAEVCPVGAITVSLGDVSQRADIPTLTPGLETTASGIFISGELGGQALIRNAVDQGVRAIESIAGQVQGARARSGVTDVLIVGAGPSGLAASMKAIELGLDYVTIDQSDIGGTIRKYPRRKLVLTQPVALPLGERIRRREHRKEELVALWEGWIDRHGVEVQTPVRLLGVERDNGHFVAETTAGPIASRFVLLALGRRGTPRRLGVPGEDQKKVMYQLADAATYVGCHILVVGGGDSAVEAATALADQPGNTVTMSYRKPGFFRLKARNEERIHDFAFAGRIDVVFSSQVERIEPDSVTLATPEGPQRIRNDFTLVFAGGVPPFPLLQGMGVGFGTEDAA